MSQRAFTLIELLVVIAIIAILAAILFPVFAQAKASAKNTQDLSNIKQISLTALIYSGDYDDTFVAAGAAPYGVSPLDSPNVDGNGNPWNGWGLKLSQYAKSKEIFRSPHFPRKGSFAGDCASSNGMELSNNYNVNYLLARDYTSYSDFIGITDYEVTPDGTQLRSPVSYTAINAPSSTIAFLLSSSTPPRGRDWGCFYTTLEASDFVNKIRFPLFYRDGSNIAYADGSAKFFIAKQLGTPNDGSDPTHTVFHWRSRNIWVQPTMPESTMGFVNTGPGGAPFGD
jgi:prepilin-type N-terminal cleavage/methylation domain-containing protein/prepilin-type processing-associated H-X9-DG protein